MENQKAGAFQIKSISQLNELLLSNKDKAIILTPFSQTSFEDYDFAPGFVPSLRSITVDNRLADNGGTGDVYEPYEKRGFLALSKQALDKIAMMAGITWKHVQRVDDTNDPFKCIYTALGEILTLDGMPFVYSADYSLDLNDGAPQATSITKAGMLSAQRKNLAMITESKAKNRVIRSLLGISHSYKPDELLKPFMILRVIPDMRDPEVARMVKAKMLGLEKYLFPVPADPASVPPALLSGGTHGLELPEPPGGTTKQIGTGTTAPIDVSATNVTPSTTQTQPVDDKADARKKLISEVEALYYTKTQAGVRDPAKPPLTELQDFELDEIAKVLRSKPQVRKPAEDLI